MGEREFRFPELLIEWARRAGLRSFPWRKERDRYRLLMAELMLRRTRAANVIDTYERFIEKWPALTDFVAAPAEGIVEVLQPLGLRWRAANFVALQERLHRSGGRELEEGYEGLLSLPGVGDYVASAVCCFSTDEARPLIDANSVRVISRVFGIPFGPETRRRRPFQEKAHQVLSARDPRTYNYALLDLAAGVCTIRTPRCEQCPLMSICEYAAAIHRTGKK